jgi:hypothetical protein
MKPLNRPMFKYGGPIKEGIMTGMKDSPQQLVKSNADGSRPGYAGPALLALPYIGTAARFLARPFGQFITKQMAKRGVTGSGGTIRSGLGRSRVLKPGEKLTEDVTKFKPNIFGKYLAGSPEGRLLTGGAGYAGKAGQTIFKAGKGLAKSPLTLATAGYYGGKKLIDQFKDDPIKKGEIPGQSTSAINKAKAAIGMPENLTYGGGREPTIDDPKKTKSEENEALKQKYYKIMGLDKMKKDAVYDSLIDASRIVSEEGGDLKGSIKSGTLQNKIIQAISGQLDKSAALKKQIDAAILKGEITKDIKANDPAEKNKARLVEKQIELADQKLSGGSLIENIEAGKKAAGGANSTANVYNSVLRTYKTEPTVLADTTEAAEFRKSDNYTTDAALVKTIVETQGKGAGIYILDKTVVYIDEQGNASTLALG